jgi:small subunit ribosomal protein S27Ae
MAGKKAVKEGKKPHKNKPASKRYNKYKLQNGKLTKERFCPRCGPGIFLMSANNRVYCGKCHYSEFKSREKTEEKK